MIKLEDCIGYILALIGSFSYYTYKANSSIVRILVLGLLMGGLLIILVDDIKLYKKTKSSAVFLDMVWAFICIFGPRINSQKLWPTMLMVILDMNLGVKIISMKITDKKFKG